MELLWDCLPETAERVRTAEGISLFLDFDGTLAPIVTDPAQARLPPATGESLARLSRDGRLWTVVISGRSLSDLWGRVGLDGLIYAGNHGLEIWGPGLCLVEPFAARRQEELRRLCAQLAARLSDIPGVKVEDKGLSATVHYRRVAAQDLRRLRRTVVSVWLPRSAGFRLAKCKKAIEIRPLVDWNKGAAVAWINQLRERSVLSIYVGDDRTDEDAFSALDGQITVRVGTPSGTRAAYWLRSQAEVGRFLNWLERAVAE